MFTDIELTSVRVYSRFPHGPQQQSPWMSHQLSSQMVWNARWLPLNDIGHLRGDQIRFHSPTLEGSMRYCGLTKLPIVWDYDAKS